MHGETKDVDVSDVVWGIYQNVGHSHTDIINTIAGRKEFIADLRKAADDLESTLPG